MVDDTFHFFSRLPAELRREIWRYCLPHKVSEIDDPIGYEVYDILEPGDIACLLYPSKVSNDCPPLLTRVCHESRSIALETGFWVPQLQARNRKLPWNPSKADNTIDLGCWRDTARNSAHMNWTPSYDILYGICLAEQSLTELAEEAEKLNGKASFMLEYMTDDDGHLRDAYHDVPRSEWYNTISPRRKEDIAALKLLPEWLVVVKVVVVHLDSARAAETGLFGLLGDERVQVVDAALPLAGQLYELAERCELQAPAVTYAQDFERVDAREMDTMVNVKRPRLIMMVRWESVCDLRSCSGCVRGCVTILTCQHGGRR